MSLFWWAQIVSVVTIVTTLLGLFQKEKWKTMLLYTIANIAMMVTYYLLGHLLGALLVAGATIRTFVYFLFSRENKPVPGLIFALFEIYFITISLFMFDGVIDLFIVMNVALVAFTTWQNDMATLRIGYVLSSALLITFNALIGAYVSILSEVVLLIASIIDIVKYDVKSKIDDIVLDFYTTIAPSYNMTLTQEANHTLVHSKQIDDVFNNFAYYNKPALFPQEKEAVAKNLKELNRTPCVYLSSVDGSDLHFIMEQSRHHQLLFHDVWMKLISGQNTKYKKCMLKGVTFKRCTETDKADILKVFIDGFIHVTGDNVYKYEDAYVDKYEKTLNDEYLKEHQIYPYMAYLDGEPISLLFMYRHNFNAYLCQITTLEKFRRQGVASSLIRYALGRERQDGIEDFFLITEKYTYLEAFYMKNNFREIAQGFCLDISKDMIEEKEKEKKAIEKAEKRQTKTPAKKSTKKTTKTVK